MNSGVYASWPEAAWFGFWHRVQELAMGLIEPIVATSLVLGLILLLGKLLARPLGYIGGLIVDVAVQAICGEGGHQDRGEKKRKSSRI